MKHDPFIIGVVVAAIISVGLLWLFCAQMAQRPTQPAAPTHAPPTQAEIARVSGTARGGGGT